MARAPFDLRRATRGFIPILQATLTLWILWCLIASDQVRLHLSITPCTFARDRTGWCSHTHHVVWPLGFIFPKFTPGPCANSRFLVDLVFRRSWTSQVSRWTSFLFWCELSLLCRSSYKPSDFIQWPSVVYPLRMRTQWPTAERLKMTVWCEFRSRVFSSFSNVVILVQLTVRIENRLTRHNPVFNQIRWFVHDGNFFPVFRKRVKVVVAASGDQDDVVSVSEIGLWCVSHSLHLLLQDYTVSSWLPKNLNH